MATLTETAFYSRKVINLLIIGFVGFVILRVIWMVFGFVIKTFFPEGPPPATYAFGRLPYPNAENGIGSPSGTIKYSLETVGNSLPKVPPTLKVYFMSRPSGNFDAYNNMKVLANKVGFTQNPIATGKSLWRFTDPETPLRAIEINQNTLNFKLTYNYQADQNLFNEGSLTSRDQSDPKNYIQQFVSSVPLDLEKGTTDIKYYKLDSGKLIPATSLSTADALSVVFKRSPIVDDDKEASEYQIVSPNASTGLISFLISPSSNPKKKILEARYYYTPIELTNWATYTTITSDQAFEYLKRNDAIIASMTNKNSLSVTIRKSYIAYLDPFPGQNYLQPVLVFSDEKGFMAYVPLVDRKYLVR